MSHRNDVSPEILKSARTQFGESLDTLSRQGPVLVVFLRHAGCPFTREAITDLSRQQQSIGAAGAKLVFVHMLDELTAKPLFEQRGMSDVSRISDPEQKLYQAFELQRGSMWQVAGPGIWWRALKTILSGNVFGAPAGDIRQLPGAFLVQDGRILKAFRGLTSSDRPDYGELAQCPLK